MSERKDLVAICERFGILNDKEASSKTDFELLQLVVNTLRHVENLTNSSQTKTNVHLHLKQNSLADSLAFPVHYRGQNSLAEASEQWNRLRKFNDLLKQDHTCRRKMLLNRLDCTIESFKWKASDTHKGSGDLDRKSQKPSMNDLIHEKYVNARKELREEPKVAISHLLAVRETECDKLLNCIVSTRNLDCQVAYKHLQRQSQKPNEMVNLKQIIIPDVPDRGGRPGEVRAPVKESFHQQNRARGRGGGFRR